MPPVLDPSKSKVDGLAFVGLSLARKSLVGHPDSETHQEAFDLNDVLDRDYEFLCSTNDDGWLVGGGEPGPPLSYKLAAKDSAHVELLRIGTYRNDWGGVPLEDILQLLGDIWIPQMEVLPTAVVANPDVPPELEIRFDMQAAPDDTNATLSSLPINWQLRFVHNQLFRRLDFPSRFCPGAFHSTIVRKAEFRSDRHRSDYFQKCQAAIQHWRKEGPKPLNTVQRSLTGTAVVNNNVDNNNDDDDDNNNDNNDSRYFHSGIWLFTDRENISHFFKPNFLPPYDTPDKRKIILDMLQEEWDEKTLSWKPCELAFH